MLFSFTSSIPFPLITLMPRLVMNFSALAASFSSNIFKIVGTASTMYRENSLSSKLYCFANTGIQSMISPTNSTPVNPAPHTVNVNKARRLGVTCSLAARSTQRIICSRILIASSIDHNVNPCSFTPCTPKSFASPPMPITK